MASALKLSLNKNFIRRGVIRFSCCGNIVTSRNTSSYLANFKSMTSSTVMLGISGLAIGALAGSAYGAYRSSKYSNKVSLEMEYAKAPAVLNKFPDKVKLSKRVIVANDSSGLKLTLFQYPTCPFCCKVRAFLDYYGLSYDIVEVNPVIRKQISWSPYKKVPILLVNIGDKYYQLFDSSMIISIIASHLKYNSIDFAKVSEYYPMITFQDNNNKKKTEVTNRYFLMGGEGPQTKNEKKLYSDEMKWRVWADDVLVHMLSPNVYRTRKEALESFRWFAEVGDWEHLFKKTQSLLVIYVGAHAMWMLGKRLKKKYRLKDDVRTSLYDSCNIWVKELKRRGTQFHGGSVPNLADLAIYGVLSSIEGCRAFGDLLENTKIGPWFYDMKTLVKSHSGDINTLQQSCT